jgi:hypothetical protein
LASGHQNGRIQSVNSTTVWTVECEQLEGRTYEILADSTTRHFLIDNTFSFDAMLSDIKDIDWSHNPTAARLSNAIRI